MAPSLVGRQGETGDRVHHLIVVGARKHKNAAVLVVHVNIIRNSQVALRLFCSCVNAEDRGEGECRTERGTPCGVGGDARRGDVGVAEVGAYGGFVQPVAVLAVVEEGAADVAAYGEAVVVGPAVVSADYTVLAVVAQGEVVVHSLGSAADAEFVALGRSVVVEDFLLPVGALAVFVRVRIERHHSRVHAALVHHHRIFAGVEHFPFSPRAGETVGEVVGNPCLAAALLGGHEYDAIGCTGSVNGAGCGVLQHFYGLDVVRVEVIYAALDRHSVHDVERVGVVDGTCTADADTRCRSWLS